MSAKTKALNALYRRGKITVAGMKKAVADGIISEDEYKAIMGEGYK